MKELVRRLSESFGYLNKKGFCSGSTCHIFAVVMGEFNVNFGQTVSTDFRYFYLSWVMPNTMAVTLCSAFRTAAVTQFATKRAECMLS